MNGVGRRRLPTRSGSHLNQSKEKNRGRDCPHAGANSRARSPTPAAWCALWRGRGRSRKPAPRRSATTSNAGRRRTATGWRCFPKPSPHLPPARPARQSLRALGARPRAGQGRRDLPDGAQPAGLRGDLDGHGARRRRDGAHQRQARRAVARPFDRHRRRQGGDRRGVAGGAVFQRAAQPPRASAALRLWRDRRRRAARRSRGRDLRRPSARGRRAAGADDRGSCALSSTPPARPACPRRRASRIRARCASCTASPRRPARASTTAYTIACRCIIPTAASSASASLSPPAARAIFASDFRSMSSGAM